MATEWKDPIRARLRTALDIKGIPDKQASQNAGLGDTFVHDFLAGSGGKFENLERLCEANGIRWEWLKEENGGMFTAAVAGAPPDREAILTAIEALLAHCYPQARPAQLRSVARGLVAIAETPPGDTSEIDRTSNIRSGILGALRLFDHQLNQGDK